MPERRNLDRPGSPDRRTFPRPPLWLNLLLLALGIGVLLYARHHREQVEARFADVITEQARTPGDVKKLKEDIAEMDLTRDALKREVEARMKLVSGLKSENFYLSVDTRAKKLRFFYGDKVLREADITVGENKTISANGKQWTFIALKGAFPIQGKVIDYAWSIPEWVYAMKGEQAPAQPQTITGGLGKYVLLLPDGYVIHTPPAEASPLDGAKPGSYMVSEDFLAAVWPRIQTNKTQVFIY